MGHAVIAARKSSEAKEELIATDRRRVDRFLSWLWASVQTQTEDSPTVGGPMFAAQNLVTPAHGSALRPARGQAPAGAHGRNGSRLSGQLPLSSLFFQKFTASGTSSAAEILGFRRFDRRNNSEKARCSVAVSAVFGRKIKSEIMPILTRFGLGA
jgi:hypothetical protein